MKLLFDFLPIVLFFIAYKLYGIFAATMIAMICSAMQLTYFYINNEKIDKTQMFTFLTILVLGGATLFFHNPVFIQWKPTILYWALAIAFLVSHFVGEKMMIEYIIGHNIQLPQKKWRSISYAFILFFIALGSVNLFVAYHYSENTWVNFKLFGILGCTLCFLTMIALYINQFGQEIQPPTIFTPPLKKSISKGTPPNEQAPS